MIAPHLDRLVLALVGALVLSGSSGCCRDRVRQGAADCPPDGGDRSIAHRRAAESQVPLSADAGQTDEYPTFRRSRQPTALTNDAADRRNPADPDQGPAFRTGPALRSAAPQIPEHDEPNETSRGPKRSPFGGLPQKISASLRRSGPNEKVVGGAAPGKSSISDSRLVSRSTPAQSEEAADGFTVSRSVATNGRHVDGAMAIVQTTPGGHNGGLPERIPENEAIRLVDPPLLRTPPIDGVQEGHSEASHALTIPRLLICRQVRGFEDVVPLDAGRLRQSQPILIYATLTNFRSMATSKGYRTLTLSTLEVRTPDGELVQRQPLGTAVDLVDVPRRDFFLTHLVSIPDDLPAGNYIFSLCVDDLLGSGSASARIAVRVTEDRSLRDGMADISRSATRPASFRR